MNKKFFFIGFLVALFALSFVVPTFAENNGNNGKGLKFGQVMKEVKMELGEGKETVLVHANGNFRLTNVMVNSVDVGGNSITGTMLGLTRTANVGGAVIWGNGEKIALGDVKVGDMLVVTGNWNSGTRVATISAVKDLSYKRQLSGDLAAKLQELIRQLNDIQAQIRALQR